MKYKLTWHQHLPQDPDQYHHSHTAQATWQPFQPSPQQPPWKSANAMGWASGNRHNLNLLIYGFLLIQFTEIFLLIYIWP